MENQEQEKQKQKKTRKCKNKLPWFPIITTMAIVAVVGGIIGGIISHGDTVVIEND